MSIKLFNSAIPTVTYPVEEQRMYSDGTPLIKGVFDTRLNAIEVLPRTMNEFVNAMFLVDSLVECGSLIDFLVLPYVPGARQDRINPTGDILFTAKSVAKMINERNFSRVIVLDPHSAVTPALIDRCKVFPLNKVFQPMLVRDRLRESGFDTFNGIIAPDAGAGHRANEVASIFGLPVYQASKHRDVSTGKLSGFSIDVPPGHYLVVDDICDGGGTFAGLGEKIKERGATADLYVSHGIFSKGTDMLKQHYQNIYTTDSREFGERNNVTVIPVTKLMREMI